MLNQLTTLALRTVQDPRTVAAELVAMALPRPVLWMALALAVVLNTIVYQISLLASPAPAEALPVLFASPLMFAFMIGAALIMSIYALTYAGRFVGGTGDLTAIMTVLVWLQYLRFAVQLAAFLVTPIMPAIGALLVLGASLYGLWLVLNFVDVAHGLNNLFTAFGVMVMAMLGIMLGLAMLLSLLGIQNLGLTPYV